jgi:hypothetical protein
MQAPRARVYCPCMPTFWAMPGEMSCDPTRRPANGCQGRHCLTVELRLRDRELGRPPRQRAVFVSGRVIGRQAVVEVLGLHGPAVQVNCKLRVTRQALTDTCAGVGIFKLTYGKLEGVVYIVFNMLDARTPTATTAFGHL